MKTMKYTLDTNVASVLDRYPDDNSWFKPIWERIILMLEKGEIIFPKIIHEEIIKGTHIINKYIKKEKHVIMPDEIQQKNITKILKEFPSWVNPNSTKNMGDPWLIALAMQKNLVIVTNEKFDLTRLKIPKVCDFFKVRCINSNDFLKEIAPQ